MDPWIVLTGLVSVTVLFVVVPVAAAAFTYWRDPRRLVCPRAGKEAQIEVAPSAAAAAAVVGGRLGLERCSLWSVVRDCREECLSVPASELTRVRRGDLLSSPATMSGRLGLRPWRAAAIDPACDRRHNARDHA
jgi:hypothetical protein